MRAIYRHPWWAMKSGAGFTLIEIVLALGVMTVALVAVLAVFPVGLRATRSGADDTQMAMIGQDYFAYFQQLALSANNYTTPNLLASADYTDAVTNETTVYGVHVVVANSGFAQISVG